MDRRLKERLVGATILVALIVAIVPELLSGPKRTSSAPAPATLPAATRTVTVDLATSKAVVPRGAELPAAAAPPAAAASAPPLESDSSSPKSAVQSGASGGSGGNTASSVWAVQLGVFASKANAERLARQLKSSGSAVYVISSGSGPSLRYRVRMGPMADRGAAERAVEKLKAQGHAATIVAPAS